jgi:hypothetical protein
LRRYTVEKRVAAAAAKKADAKAKVGRCSSAESQPVLIAPVVSALLTRIP